METERQPAAWEFAAGSLSLFSSTHGSDWIKKTQSKQSECSEFSQMVLLSCDTLFSVNPVSGLKNWFLRSEDVSAAPTHKCSYWIRTRAAVRRPEDTEGSILEQMLHIYLLERRPRSWSRCCNIDHVSIRIVTSAATIQNVSVALR